MRKIARSIARSRAVRAGLTAVAFASAQTAALAQSTNIDNAFDTANGYMTKGSGFAVTAILTGIGLGAIYFWGRKFSKGKG